MVGDKKMEKLPEGWKFVRLGEIIEGKIRNGFTYNYYQITQKGIPVARIETISDGHIDISKVGYISEILAKKIMKFRLQVGDILLSHINSFEHVGKAAIYKGIPQLLIHGMNLLLIRLSKDKCEPFYLIKFLKQKKIRNEIRALSGQAVNQVSIKPYYLANLLIPIPPLPEQRKIAEILETVDNSIEKTDKIIEKYKRIKQGLMQVLLTKGIVESDELGVRSYESENGKSDELGVRNYEAKNKSFELEGKKWEIRSEKKHKFKDSPLGRIPEEWEVVELGETSSRVDYGYTESANYEEVGPKFLRITDIQDNKVDWDKVPFCLINAENAKKYILKTGDIVFARTGATTGKSFYIKNPPFAIFASYLIRIRFRENIDSKFASYFFNSEIYWDQINSDLSGSTQEGVNASKLKKIKIPLPLLPEQQRIASILSQIDETIEKEEKYKAKLERIKQGLMEDLLTGKIRVNHLIEGDGNND